MRQYVFIIYFCVSQKKLHSVGELSERSCLASLNFPLHTMRAV